MEIKRYARIFKQAAANRFAFATSDRSDFWAFIAGKLIRMGFFVVLAVSLFLHTKSILGYSEGQVLMFFAIMNLVDVLVQAIWYRGLYSLKDFIRVGKFDMFLVQPVSPLFKLVGMQLDLLDIITIPFALGFVIFAWTRLPSMPNLPTVLLAVVLFVCSMLLAFSLNLCIATLAFWTTETESAWGLYRDSLYVARFPSEIFPSLIRSIFTFGIPVLAIVVFPVKEILGLASPTALLYAFGITAAWLLFALAFWKFGLTHYTSASG